MADHTFVFSRLFVFRVNCFNCGTTTLCTVELLLNILTDTYIYKIFHSDNYLKFKSKGCSSFLDTAIGRKEAETLKLYIYFLFPTRTQLRMGNGHWTSSVNEFKFLKVDKNSLTNVQE